MVYHKNNRHPSLALNHAIKKMIPGAYQAGQQWLDLKVFHVQSYHHRYLGGHNESTDQQQSKISVEIGLDKTPSHTMQSSLHKE